ncbi:hypothetical protein [Actinomadura sp. CNU-125]|uniref:hypothetical protein n=1 Tax=Actinomadura sp. CNU-125 TaxID=1904961 RepID=UPI0009FAD05C|nr:hypothetical protein [Actinomadura sp. CNU-125]
MTPATVEGAAAAGRALDWLGSGELGGLVSRTLVVLTVHAPVQRRLVDAGKVREILRDVGADVQVLGFDRQLAAGAEPAPSRLAYATRTTAIAVAATALRRALTT